MAVNLPFIGDISNKGALRNLRRDEEKTELAIARADIAIARVRGQLCRKFLFKAEMLMESDQVNPGDICRLIDLFYDGVNVQLLDSALTALTQVETQGMADQIIDRVENLHNIHGVLATDVGVSRLVHPAGG